jgi:hypothetical protein
MTPAELERRFLDFVYTTDATITPGALAYFARCTMKEAESLLDELARQGTIRIEHDEQGLIFYVFPGRTKLTRAPSETAPRPLGGGLHIGGGVFPPPAATPVPHVSVQAQRALVPVTPGEPPGPVLPGGQTACPYCGETILSVAKKCKHCGEMIDPALRQALVPVQVNVGIQNVPQAGPAVPIGRPVNPGAAAALNFIWPGAGHMYAGRIGAGIGWMFAVFIGYLAFVVPGFALHMASLFAGAKAAREENAKNGHLTP